MGSINVDLNDEANKVLQEMAKKNGMSLSLMCKYILEEFCYQGKVYTGAWKEGPGVRVLVDYPKYSSRVIKLKNEELK